MKNFEIIGEENNFTLRRKTKLRTFSVWWFRGYCLVLFLLFLGISGTLKREPPRDPGIALIWLMFLFGVISIYLIYMLAMDADRFRGRLRVNQEAKFDLRPHGRVTIDNDPNQSFATHRLWSSVLLQPSGRGSTVSWVFQYDLVITCGERVYVLENLENEEELEDFREIFIAHQGDEATISKGYTEYDWSKSVLILPFLLILSFGLNLVGIIHATQPPIFHIVSWALCFWSSLFFFNCLVASRSSKKLQKMYVNDLLQEVKPVYQAFWINPRLAFLLTAGIHVAYYMLAIRGL